jgi:hypothetical protein
LWVQGVVNLVVSIADETAHHCSLYVHILFRQYKELKFRWMILSMQANTNSSVDDARIVGGYCSAVKSKETKGRIL